MSQPVIEIIEEQGDPYFVDTLIVHNQPYVLVQLVQPLDDDDDLVFRGEDLRDACARWIYCNRYSVLQNMFQEVYRDGVQPPEGIGQFVRRLFCQITDPCFWVRVADENYSRILKEHEAFRNVNWMAAIYKQMLAFKQELEQGPEYGEEQVTLAFNAYYTAKADFERCFLGTFDRMTVIREGLVSNARPTQSWVETAALVADSGELGDLQVTAIRLSAAWDAYTRLKAQYRK